ncbi:MULTISPECIES: hypothetical protein [unclassified Yoonia]|uniref:hypothetical protein n=1 Tax=unclassified Yoonia TaxID=2629118 RepID=UPI002AFFA769|nr:MULTISPECIES: hypothetical protein [unclassified Yoonia]
MIRAGWAVVFYLLLAACGGGGGNSSGPSGGGDDGPVVIGPPPVPQLPPPDPRIARLDGYEALKIEVLGGSGSGRAGLVPTTADLPMQGTAAFTGFGSLRVEGAPVFTLFGDARVDVDFGTQQVSGDVRGFFGTGPDGQVADYAGVLSLSAGSVRRDLLLDYAGSLSGAGQQLAVTGRIEATFLGDPIRAISGVDLDTQVLRNGEAAGGTMLIVAKTPAVQVP